MRLLSLQIVSTRREKDKGCELHGRRWVSKVCLFCRFSDINDIEIKKTLSLFLVIIFLVNFGESFISS